jgi:hypothetical protein
MSSVMIHIISIDQRLNDSTSHGDVHQPPVAIEGDEAAGVHEHAAQEVEGPPRLVAVVELDVLGVAGEECRAKLVVAAEVRRLTRLG